MQCSHSSCFYFRFSKLEKMDTITEEDVSPQTQIELSAPPSPKRPRTNCTMTNDHSGKSRFDFPELLTFRKAISSPSSTTILQENTGLESMAESGDFKDTQLTVTPISRLTTSHTDDAHTGSSEVCVISAEISSKPLLMDEQGSVSETNTLSVYMEDDAGGALAESSKETSSHPDCNRLGKSLEDEPPGGCSLQASNDEDGIQVQNSVSQIQAFTFSSSVERVRCQSDCKVEDVPHDTGFCDTWSQSESNQKRGELGFSENILLIEEKAEGCSAASPPDYTDSTLFCSNPEEHPSGILAESVKNEEEILQLHICEKENVAVCEGETKSRDNENAMSKSSIPSAAECAEGSIVCYDVVLATNIAIESVSHEAEDFCAVKGEHAAGKMIAKAGSETADHTTDTPLPARISQGPTGGDNEASPFSVIDPAIWIETDKEAEEKRRNSESTADVELFASGKVCEMETPLTLCCDVGLSQEVSAPDQFNHQNRTECRDEKEISWQSHSDPQACLLTTDETHRTTGNEGSCHRQSSPCRSPCRPAHPSPAGGGTQENHDTEEDQMKEPDQSSCFPVSPKTQEVEYFVTNDELARMDGETEMKEREGITSFKEEITTEKSPVMEGNLLHKIENHIEHATEEPTGDCVVYIDWTEGNISKHGNTFTHLDEQLGNNVECFSDHSYNVVITTMEGKTEEQEREEASVKTDVQYLEILEKSEHDQQQKEDMTEECISNCTEDKTSKIDEKQENKLSCFSDYQHRAETFMLENKDDLSAFTSPPTSDAVVPSPHELHHLQNADSNPTALNATDRFPPVPSALTLNDRVPGGFDTFEKIQLSLEYEDGLSNSPLLTSLDGQQQLQHSMPEAESNEQEEVPEEVPEEEEKEMDVFECHTENMAKGFLSQDTSYNQFPKCIPASSAHVIAIGRPEQQPNCESSFNSFECFGVELDSRSTPFPVPSKSDSRASDVNEEKFEMKKQFDMVLRELNLYFEISLGDLASESRASSPEQVIDITEALKDDTSICKEEHLRSPEGGSYRDTSSGNCKQNTVNASIL